ncbi:MAG: hypothetical protein CSB47_08005 [Proteobacteria bacterium]|nr:MAG: hypothetical protein CSB47_08005 [Pseudomonadota bacterium]
MRILIIALITLNILYFVGVYLFSVAFDRPPPLKEPGIPTIKLLEMSAADNLPRVASGASPVCFTVGPYSVEKTARLVAHKIAEAGFAVNIHKQQTDQVQKYLVFLPVQPSRAAAEKVVADIKANQIKQRQIKQYSIIDSGPYKNAIALGRFNDLDRARRHAEYVRFLGYDARYTEQRQRAYVYWISYDEPFGESLPVSDWTKEIDPKVSVQKLPEACEF